jgi:hypothetical protein
MPLHPKEIEQKTESLYQKSLSENRKFWRCKILDRNNTVSSKPENPVLRPLVVTVPQLSTGNVVESG